MQGDAAARLLAIAFCAIAQPACADTLSVTTTGTIPGTCGLTVASSFPSNADLATSGASAAGALVNCSTPFKINATSANGGFKNSVPAVTGFTNSLTYSLNVSVSLDSGGPVSATCGSATLVSGQSSCALSPGNGTGLSSGAGIATNKTTTLTASWVTPTTPHLIAGTYSDTLTISIAATP